MAPLEWEASACASTNPFRRRVIDASSAAVEANAFSDPLDLLPTDDNAVNFLFVVGLLSVWHSPSSTVASFSSKIPTFSIAAFSVSNIYGLARF